jgi:membrane protease YdiL (CAAX protease family)
VCLLALEVPVVDLILVWAHAYWVTPARTALALATALFLSEVSRGYPNTLRSPLTPAPNWGFWLWLGVILAAVGIVAVGIVFTVPHPMLDRMRAEIPRLYPDGIPEALYRMCVDAPLVEEVIYRQALCGAMIALAGRGWAIIVSGVVFAGLHWIYGNPSIENQLGGFVLAWMYLRSGTLAIPIIFHSVGNLGALFAQLLAGHLWPHRFPSLHIPLHPAEW